MARSLLSPAGKTRMHVSTIDFLRDKPFFAVTVRAEVMAWR